jgi:hypothetical protein
VTPAPKPQSLRRNVTDSLLFPAIAKVEKGKPGTGAVHVQNGLAGAKDGAGNSLKKCQ